MGPMEPKRHLRGVDDAVDQVARRFAFQADRPEWQIWCDGQYRWHAQQDGGERIDALDLRGLLDELERLYRT